MLDRVSLTHSFPPFFSSLLHFRCFLGKQRYVASIACLKRALYLDPFEWIISYNLGLVHLNTDQYASAFHYLSASINLKPDFPSSYMYLGITLSRLDDFENACSAYEKAIRMESDHLFELNYAITLYNHNEIDNVRKHDASTTHRHTPHAMRATSASGPAPVISV